MPSSGTLPLALPVPVCCRLLSDCRIGEAPTPLARGWWVALPEGSPCQYCGSSTAAWGPHLKGSIDWLVLGQWTSGRVGFRKGIGLELHPWLHP